MDLRQAILPLRNHATISQHDKKVALKVRVGLLQKWRLIDTSFTQDADIIGEIVPRIKVHPWGNQENAVSREMRV